mgnify:CR=1 FL=1
MSSNLTAPPVLSTPDDNIFPAAPPSEAKSSRTEVELRDVYEIDRTIIELQAGKWTRIALQFPDHMLVDAPKVAEILQMDLTPKDDTQLRPRIAILADTSYSACCVDEIAAEHADSEVVVHYGRTCLSPTSRLPAIYIYTRHKLDLDSVVAAFGKEFADKDAKVVLVADLTYQNHIPSLYERLHEAGYTKIIATKAARDPSAVIPNRIVDSSTSIEKLCTFSLFHISDPPMSLLLALQSRFTSLHVLSTTSPSLSIDNPTVRAGALLRRRFAKVLTLATAGVIGILVNTLSVSNYMASIGVLRKKIDQAGKKSYTIVVGKLNPAKLANFAEIEGWVVVGCWESGLIEDDDDYWRPVITPFEMEVALMREEERVWGSEWWGGIEKLSLEDEPVPQPQPGGEPSQAANGSDTDLDEDESLPPEFDLRTGRFVSHSRPMRVVPVVGLSERSTTSAGNSDSPNPEASSLIKRTVGELASVNGVVSPGAEFLRSQRTWQGLGSDFDKDASTLIEEGRSGVARGYTVGEDAQEKH